MTDLLEYQNEHFEKNSVVTSILYSSNIILYMRSFLIHGGINYFILQIKLHATRWLIKYSK